MVDDWCDHFRANGSKLHYGQKPIGKWGLWSEMGKVDKKFANLLKKSGVAAWKSWSSRICVVPEQGRAAAFVFNSKGVDPMGPWWHQEELEETFDMKFCGAPMIDIKMNLAKPTPDCHDFPKFLGPAVNAITTFLEIEPQVTILNSNLWDVDRLRYQKNKPWASFTEPSFLAEWKRNATKLHKAVKEMVPNSKVIWHTAPLGLHTSDTFAFKEKPKIMNLAYKSMDAVLPGSHFGVTAINNALREFAQEEGIPVEEMDLKDMKYRDGYHPAEEFNINFMENAFNYIS